MFGKFPAVPIDIKKDDTTLGVNETMLLQQRYYSMDKLDQANDSLGNKAIALIQASSLIFALIGGLKFPDIIYNPSGFGLAAIAVAFILFMVMIWLLLQVWSPGSYALPGTNDWEKIHRDYLFVDQNESFTQILDNCVEAYSRLKLQNKIKSRRLTVAVYLFSLQIAGLLAIAMFAS